MSKSALIASVALYFAGRGAAADRAVDQVTAIKSKAIQAIARARAAGRSGPEKARTSLPFPAVIFLPPSSFGLCRNRSAPHAREDKYSDPYSIKSRP